MRKPTPEKHHRLRRVICARMMIHVPNAQRPIPQPDANADVRAIECEKPSSVDPNRLRPDPAEERQHPQRISRDPCNLSHKRIVRQYGVHRPKHLQRAAEILQREPDAAPHLVRHLFGRTGEHPGLVRIQSRHDRVKELGWKEEKHVIPNNR